jgi:hypothetical protein
MLLRIGPITNFSNRWLILSLCRNEKAQQKIFQKLHNYLENADLASSLDMIYFLIIVGS